MTAEVCTHEDAYGSAVWDDICINCDTRVVRSLSGSWRELEEALPNGWSIEALRHRWDGWVAEVAEPIANLNDSPDFRRVIHEGSAAPGPAEALRALAARLRARP